MILSPALNETIRSHAASATTRSFYLYDTRVMQNKIAHLKSILPDNVEIFYAMKANPHTVFLDAAMKAGVVGIEIASLGEAEKAVTAGFKAERLIYTGPGKAPEELEWSVSKGVRTINIESLVEAHRLNKICTEKKTKQDILLRVNPNFHIHGAQANFSGDSNKLGIDEAKLYEILPQILKLEKLRFRGLHVYAASGVLKVEDLLKNCELVFAMAQTIEEKFTDIACDYIDFGGGFGIDYMESGHDFSPDVYAVELKKLIAKYGFENRRFVLELGRYLAADSGWYCTEILDIKDSLGIKQVVCAGGSNHFRRPAALKINHPLVIVGMSRPIVFEGQEQVDKEKVYVVGPLCNTADKLVAQEIYVEKAVIGDIAVFGLAGAYGLSMSHIEFLSHARPQEIVL